MVSFAPFENEYKAKNQDGSIILISTQDTENEYGWKGGSGNGKTRVYKKYQNSNTNNNDDDDNDDNNVGDKVDDLSSYSLQYSFPDGMFIGRRKISISPDGSIVIMEGNLYCPDLLRSSKVDPDEVVASVYHNGVLVKEIKFASDLNRGKSLPSHFEDFLGGWVFKKNIIPEVQVDWSQNVIIYKVVETGSLCSLQHSLTTIVRKCCCLRATRSVVIPIPVPTKKENGTRIESDWSSSETCASENGAYQ